MKNLDDLMEDSLIASANKSLQEKHKDEDIEIVGMNDKKTIEFSSEDKEIRLYSEGVEGCNVFVVLIKTESGKNIIHFSHYDPTLIDEQILQLQEILSKEKITKIKLIAITPEDYVKKDGKFVVEESESFKKGLSRITSMIQDIEDKTVKTILYTEYSGEDISRFVSLQIESAGKNISARMRWWDGADETFE